MRDLRDKSSTRPRTRKRVHTAAKLAKIRLEHDQLLAILENIPAIADVVDIDTHMILYMNRYARSLFGDDSLSKLCYQVFHGYKEACPFCTNDLVRRNPDTPCRSEFRSETTNRDYLATNVAIPWPGGRRVKLEFSVDITERKNAERATRRLSTAVRDAAEAIIITRPDGTIDYVNPAFEKMTGYSADEVYGMHVRILKSGAHDKTFYKNLWTTLLRGATWRGQFINKRKDGTRYVESASISPVYDTRGQMVSYVAVKRDITHERQLEDQIRQSQKMAALGQLSNRMAHDFTNTLMSILGHAELAKRSVKEPALIENMEQIIAAGRRMSSFTSQLLSFAHPSPPNSQVIPIDNVVKSMGTMLQRTAGAMVSLSLNASSGCRICADPSQIEQVIVHMAINAMEAMPAGGQLEISVSRYVPAAGMPSDAPLPPAEYAVISMRDSGNGMPPEVAHRVFEPFFTTKKDKRNAGLGLSISYNIIAQHGGHITVESHPGQGSTFRILLPVVRQAE